MRDTRYHLTGTFILLLFLAMPASAQVGGQFGLDFSMAVPRGEFQQNVDQAGFGINLSGGIQLRNTPVLLGIDGGVMVYGSERRFVPLSMTIPDITAEVQTTNNIALFHGMVRLQPPTGTIRPYVDGLFGFRYLFTRTSLQDDFDEEVIGSTNFDDIAPSYGFGAGLDILLHDGPMGESKKPGRVYLTLGLRYLTGGEAEYLREGDIEREPGTIHFTPTRSNVELLQPRLGVTFAF